MTVAYLAHRGELVRFLTGRLRCAATAEDLVQDVYCRLASAAGEVDHVRALLFTTAGRLALNHLRDERRRQALRDDAWAPLQDQADLRSPERAALANDQLRRLAIELAAWPARTREIFILNRFDGLTQAVIAQQLRISQTAVENHMAKAIRRLAAALEASA
ncbi:RNA polymerase sigma factor [Brevundimonas sp. LM2]|uniref:RNA polymerase sigma factor n=1 Tax=Brevundimonas sp. LM2 TaxID=1938605 RepID=UPI0015C5228C|nr:sigma-70 family RNA polymerase sigma factor [Brevundimonas sp. LM2]